MRYSIKSVGIVRSENAAQTDKHPSKFLTLVLKDLGPHNRCIDYGCGKLRYFKTLKKLAKQIDLVDSSIQLERGQILFGKRTSIKEFLRKSNQCRALTTKEFLEKENYYDFGLCANVLSTVPFVAIRSAIIRRIYKSLKDTGKCLFVVQYQNSRFKKRAAYENASSLGDGFVIQSLRGPSFYGLIVPEDLEEIVTREGFKKLWAKRNDGSVFLLVEK